MREQLNNNPVVQVALIGVLAALALFVFVLKPGGGEEEESSSAGPTVATVNGVTATGSSPGEAVENAVAGIEEGSVTAVGSGATPISVPVPPPPADYRRAYEANKTVVLLVVHDGGIDDRRVASASRVLPYLPNVALIEVPVRELPRYAAITVGLELNRVPALVVVRPRNLSGGVPQASIDYGFQTVESVVQAVRDASYKGPEKTYHPE